MAIASIGTRGTAVSGASSTTIARAPTATVAAGRVLIGYLSTREDVAVDTVTDAQGNTWEFLGRYSNATSGIAHVEAWMCLVENQLGTGDTITFTFGSAVVDVCLSLWEFSVATGKTLAQSVPAETSEVNGANGFGSSSFAGLPSLQRLYLRIGGKRVNSQTTITATTNFTTHALNLRSRNNNANAIILRAEHRINTSTGETSNPTLAVSGDTAGLFFALEEADPPAPAQNLTQNTRFDNDNTFFGHTVTAGAVTLTAARYDNDPTFYTHEITQAAPGANLLPTRYDNEQTFYGATVAPGAVNLQPGLYSNAQTFYAHTVAPGAITLTPGLYTNNQVFYSPVVAISGGPQELFPDRLESTSTVFAPTVNLGATTLQPPRVDATNAFYEVTVTLGAVNLQPALLSNGNEFYEHSVQIGATTLVADRFDNANAFYGGQINLNITFPDWVEPGHVEPGWVGWPYFNENQFFGATVTGQGVAIAPPYFENTNQFYAHKIIALQYFTLAEMEEICAYLRENCPMGGGSSNLIMARRR
jgi:hypothetical protein